MPFIDEAARDPSLAAFLDEVRDVVKRRDVERFLTMAARDVYVGTYQRGRGELRAALKEGRWEWIERALAQGGAFDARRAFIVPFHACIWPAGLPRFEEGAQARRPSALLRDAPATDARVLRDVGGEYIEVQGPRHEEMVAVRTVDGLIGYMAMSEVEDLHMSDFQLAFTKHYGRWRLDYATSPWW